MKSALQPLFEQKNLESLYEAKQETYEVFKELSWKSRNGLRNQDNIDLDIKIARALKASVAAELAYKAAIEKEAGV